MPYLQVLSLESGDLDWLARHMDHDINVHRNFYRLHDDTIELAKVTKLFWIVAPFLLLRESPLTKWMLKISPMLK